MAVENLSGEGVFMEPKITSLDLIYLAGMSFYGDPFSTHGAWSGENEIGRLWTRCMAYLEGHRDQLQSLWQAEVMYEVHVYNDETISKGLFEVFVGGPLKAPEGVPPELLIKTLPAGEYAVFTLEGDEISTDWYAAAETWIGEAGYQRAQSYIFQLYDERFKGVEQIEDSILDVYIPVSPAD